MGRRCMSAAEMVGMESGAVFRLSRMGLRRPWPEREARGSRDPTRTWKSPAAFAAGPPAKVSVVSLTQVGFALVYDVAIWKHTFSHWSLVGMVLVVTPTGLLLWANRQGLAAAPWRSQETP